MSEHFSSKPYGDGFVDLLVEEFTVGLDSELRTPVSAAHRSADEAANILAFETAAASVAMAFAFNDGDSLPADLRERCLALPEAVHTDQRADEGAFTPSSLADREPLRFTPKTQPATARSGSSLGWLAAAACLAFAVVAWWPSSSSSPGEGGNGSVQPVAAPAELRESLIAEAADVISYRWQAWGEQYASVTGDVVWSEERQEGYMTLSGLPANDPNREQYQLWIVESSRGVPLETAPVDGGFFDIPDAGEIVVPIRAALPSRGVVAFGITLEPAGGVVVSDQARKVVIAAAPPAQDAANPDSP